MTHAAEAQARSTAVTVRVLVAWTMLSGRCGLFSGGRRADSRLQAARGNAGLVDSLLRRARARAEDGPAPWRRAKRTFDRVAGVTLPIVGGGVSFQQQRSDRPAATISPEDLADALATLAQEVRKDQRSGGVLISVDEIQAADHADLTLLAAALQGLNTEYPDTPVMFAASGLPQTFQELIAAGVTHPDRLFRPVPLVLEPDDARYAIVEPARRLGVAWEPEAADMIIQTSRGYPAHLQVFAETWMAAPGPTITVADADADIRAGAATLERESRGPRFDGLSDREREFLTALAVDGGCSRPTCWPTPGPDVSAPRAPGQCPARR